MNKIEKLRQQILSQNPTEEQRDAIFSDELEFLLRASPGSGKTWTSCRRFIWRGANWDYKVGGLALLSFTNVAIHEFYEATIKVGCRELLSDPNYIGTFDSFVERFIITPFGHLITGSAKRPKLFTESHSAFLKGTSFSTLVEFNNGTRIPIPTSKLTPMIENKKVVYGFQTPNGKLTKVKVLSKTSPPMALMKAGYISHEHRKFWAFYLLKKRPYLCQLLARRFPEIIVDEAQDTNEWLIQCLKVLHDAGTKVTLVGDPDQCIYEFMLAHPESLEALKTDWKIPELPLSKSFRCNNPIASSAANISGNDMFIGCSNARSEYENAFIVREPTKKCIHSISIFEKLLESAFIGNKDASILCRAHADIDSIRGKANYNTLQGNTKLFAHAAFLRDGRKDFKKAFNLIESCIRALTAEDDIWVRIEENGGSEEAEKARLVIWRFLKSQEGLPSVSEISTEWIDNLKTNLISLFKSIGITNPPKLGHKIRKHGLSPTQQELPLFQPQTPLPPTRLATIHQVKGESIDGVLVLGSVKFFNAVVRAIESDDNTEDRRLAYVAMTRARHTLIIGLPASHYDQYSSSWQKWGFQILQN
ncbi:MAG: ATP-dependent helicase [Candidatus Hatepunaea meridiana]|nr:ATP-dependent helicase [Candidatus Hatepunaea meridiana]